VTHVYLYDFERFVQPPGIDGPQNRTRHCCQGG
jgi:hypothetical protein